MKIKKISQLKVFRTIQGMKKNIGIVQIVDNRNALCLKDNKLRNDSSKSCHISNNVIQEYMGSNVGDPNHVCSCNSIIIYKEKGKSLKSVAGSGGNDSSSKSDVLNIFRSHGLYSLVNIPSLKNPVGQCAEPHAVADALSNIPKSAKIECIKVGQSVMPSGNIKKRCTTCIQWVPGEKVKKEMLIQKRYH